MNEKILVGPTEIADGSVRPNPTMDLSASTNGKFKEVIVYVKFPPQIGGKDALIGVPHTLGKIPTSARVMQSGRHVNDDPNYANSALAAAPTGRGNIISEPGVIYTDSPAPFTTTSVAFRCKEPYTWAYIALS
jgi:hypothetical protein